MHNATLSTSFFFLMIRRPPRSTLFPYTTLFRSDRILAETPALSRRARLVTLSFDPEFDDPARMAELRKHMAPRGRWSFLTAPDAAALAPVLADFGTAITIGLVGDDGMFLGGTISPGLRLSALSRAEHTAALTEVDIHVPEQVLGVDTESAIRSGVVHAAVGALREITERYAETLSKWPVLIASAAIGSLPPS